MCLKTTSPKSPFVAIQLLEPRMFHRVGYKDSYRPFKYEYSKTNLWPFLLGPKELTVWSNDES